MTALVALTNIVLGLAYTGYGVMTVIEMRRDARTYGFSHFGLAWIFMAFTCGPHHFDHGLHVAIAGRAGGGLDLFAVVVGLPVGVLWLYLRIEAFVGGRGDRFVFGTPRWLAALPIVSGGYLVVMVLAIARVAGGLHHVGAMVVANLILVPIYMAIGWFILRTQLANRPGMGGWSVSGICLSVIFPTCALMHAVWAAYAVSGRYVPDIHGFAIDWLSIPAGLYFLWVVRSLYRESLHDWNDGPGVVDSDPGRWARGDLNPHILSDTG
ncbi:MAG: hypothetical protein JOY57_18165, partial [Actinobacteria bacterium]|nr:hypothetical protein [Actinomycetota bacterium]